MFAVVPNHKRHCVTVLEQSVPAPRPPVPNHRARHSVCKNGRCQHVTRTMRPLVVSIQQLRFVTKPWRRNTPCRPCDPNAAQNECQDGQRVDGRCRGCGPETTKLCRRDGLEPICDPETRTCRPCSNDNECDGHQLMRAQNVLIATGHPDQEECRDKTSAVIRPAKPPLQ